MVFKFNVLSYKYYIVMIVHSVHLVPVKYQNIYVHVQKLSPCPPKKFLTESPTAIYLETKYSAPE